MSETHICPRRPGDGNSPFKLPDHDTWDTDRWSRNDDSEWPEELGKPPRTCSFCGCVHVEDLIDMIQNRGFEINPSTKGYKWYIEAPGFLNHSNTMLDEIKKGVDPADYLKEHGSKSIKPPIKFYAHHATKLQIELLNGLYRRQCQLGPIQ